MKKVLFLSMYCLLVVCATATSARTNPDQITVYFPAFTGQEALGQNVSTVLSLQLAQTTRKKPWPKNPNKLDFGKGMIKWSPQALKMSKPKVAIEKANSLNLLAQIVVLGKTQSYGTDVVTEVEVIVPEYQAAGKKCNFTSRIPCDFRQQNFEVWTIKKDGKQLDTPLPRRRYNIAGIVLDKKVTQKFKAVKGLPIKRSIQSNTEIGRTGNDLRFLEFNRHLSNAPTKLRSNGVEGYVSMPKIAKKQSEFADMTGGLLQIFRSDWQAAQSSLSRVINNSSTRLTLKIDAYLLRGMVKFRRKQDGLADIKRAVELAPYDAGAARYLIAAMIASNQSNAAISQSLSELSYLFAADDPWLRQVRAFLAA